MKDNPQLESKKGCTKPNCDCVEKAEQANGGNPVKSYPCLNIDLADLEKEKSGNGIKSLAEYIPKNVQPIPSQSASIEQVEQAFSEWFKKHGAGFIGIKDGFFAGAQWQSNSQQQVDNWIPISEYPKDSPVVQRWHKIYQCVISVKHRRAYAENQCEWLNGTLDNKWPEAAFEPFFKPLPNKPQ